MKCTLPESMKISCCLTCTLASAMRDCKNCPFNIGLLYKAFEQVKAEAVILPGHLRENFVQKIGEFQHENRQI